MFKFKLFWLSQRHWNVAISIKNQRSRLRPRTLKESPVITVVIRLLLRARMLKLKSDIMDNKNGVYEVSCSADFKMVTRFLWLSPFWVVMLLKAIFHFNTTSFTEVYSTDNFSENLLNRAVTEMAGIPWGRVWVRLFDTNGPLPDKLWKIDQHIGTDRNICFNVKPGTNRAV